MWDITKKPLVKAAFGGSMLIVAWSLSGGAMYAMARLDVFKLQGFDSLGVYSLLITSIIGSVFIFQIVKRLALEKREDEQKAKWTRER